MSCAVSRCFLRHFRIIWSFQGHFWVMYGAYHKRHNNCMLITMHPASEARSTTINNYRLYCPNNNSLVNNTLGYCGGSGGYEALLLSAFLPPAFLLPIGSNT